MILTVEELRRYVDTEMEDQALEAKLQALELSIKGYTNNNFLRVLEEHGGEYPMDVKMGVVGLIKWENGVGKKQGVASETISRHSVTYESSTEENFALCYPKKQLGFLKPYMCARFGQWGGHG